MQILLGQKVKGQGHTWWPALTRVIGPAQFSIIVFFALKCRTIVDIYKKVKYYP